MRVTTLLEDLRQAANAPAPDRRLYARAAAELEVLKAGYQRILALPPAADVARARKIAEEYV